MHPMETAERNPVRWFGVPARALLLVALTVYAGGMVAYQAVFAVEDDEDYGRIVGRPYSDVMFHLGAPKKIEPNGDAGTILHYDEIRAVDGIFVKSHLRIFVDPQSRTYALERD